MSYAGSCLCGAVRFEVDGEFDALYLCHCERCRKDTGSAHAANMFSATARLRWLSGEDMVRTHNFKQSGHIKSFCRECGAALPNVQMDGALLVVPAGSLDEDVPIAPTAHIFCARRANWDAGLETVRCYDGAPGDG